MDQSSWLGLALGVFIGAAYGLLQRWSMLSPARGLAGAFGGAVLRLVGVMVVILLVLRYTGADRFWLVSAVLVSYGLVFGSFMVYNVFIKKPK